jgi:hypothetical protein
MIGDVSWHNQQMFLVETDDGLLPGASTRRAQVDQETVESLMRLLPRVETLLSARVKERHDQLVAALNEALPSGEIEGILRNHRCTIGELFGGEDVATWAVGTIKAGQGNLFMTVTRRRPG